MDFYTFTLGCLILVALFMSYADIPVLVCLLLYLNDFLVSSSLFPPISVSLLVSILGVLLFKCSFCGAGCAAQILCSRMFILISLGIALLFPLNETK